MVVGIEKNDGALVLDDGFYLVDDLVGNGISDERDDVFLEEGQALRSAKLVFDVHGNDPSRILHDMKQGGKVEGRPALESSGFDDEVRLNFLHDFLDRPHIVRGLLDLHAQPVGLLVDLFYAVVEEMEVFYDIGLGIKRIGRRVSLEIGDRPLFYEGEDRNEQDAQQDNESVFLHGDNSPYGSGSDDAPREASRMSPLHFQSRNFLVFDSAHENYFPLP